MSYAFFRKVLDVVRHPKKIYCSFLSRTSRLWPDKIYLKLMYRLKIGGKLDLENPQTFSAKLQWLKLYDRKDIYTTMVDKIEVKKYVASIIGNKYIIPTLGVWKDPYDIDFYQLPNQFVLKCNHNSGAGMFICRDKAGINEKCVREGLVRGLKEDYFLTGREWPYKNVQRQILAEKFIKPAPGMNDLPDYKFFCFNGKVKALFIATDRQVPGQEVKFDFFDENFNHLNLRQGHDNSSVTPQKPISFDEMKALAEKLSKGFPHIRIDFYEVNGRPLFGELTLFHFSGLMPFEPKEWDIKFGHWLDLPQLQ